MNTASVASLVAWPNNTIYNASKAGVLLLTKSIAIDYASYSIRANCIAPGVIDTPMTERAIAQAPDQKQAKKEKGSLHPLGRLGTPFEVAQAVLFLSSEEASFITGTVIPIDGGYTAQ